MILIVEDNPVNAKVITMILSRHGYSMHLAASGAEALQFMRDSTQDMELLLTDIGMPEMDGFELVRQMREDPRFHHTPVIFVTSFADLSTVKKAARLGCAHYVIKPINSAVLIETRHFAGLGDVSAAA